MPSIEFLTKRKFSLRILFIFALILTLTLSFEAQVAPGDPDTSFGDGGVIRSAIGNIRSVALQPDGKIVTVGDGQQNYNGVIARYNQDGTFDSSFGTGGIINPPAPWLNFFGNVLAIQPDGKILIGGGNFSLSNVDGVTGIARYNANGTLDTSFGNEGTVITSTGNIGVRPYLLKIQTNGKIIIGNSVYNDEDSGFKVARYNSDGTLDTTFGNGGSVTTTFTNLNIGPNSAVIQSDGKIVILARVYQTTFDLALVRYNADGSLDSSFGTDGKVIIDIRTSHEFPSALAIQADGKIVAVGFTGSASGGFVIVRSNTDGSLDTSFGNGGIVKGLGDAHGAVIQSNGKIVVAGRVFNTFLHAGFITRYNTNGSLDLTFGKWGEANPPFTSSSQFHSLTIQPDGKIIGAGNILARFHGDRGTRNSLFDFDGDGKADQSVFRNGFWYLLQSRSGFSALQFGYPTDKITPADYDEDGKTDIAVFRDGIWYLQRSLLGFTGIHFGQAGDIPVPADYDGDGKADLAVYRNGVWYISQTGLGHVAGLQFGAAADKPVPADYDGDGKADAAVFRDGIWYVLGSEIGFTQVHFGLASDIPVPADYDGDGKADYAVFREGIWYLLQSTDGFNGMQFGTATDIPVAADYDGDGKTDIAVYRDGIWYLLQSQQGFAGVTFGLGTDKPVPNTFAP